MKAQHRWVKVFFSLIIVFFTIELMLRIIHPLYIQYGSFPSHIYQYNPVTYYTYRPGISFEVGRKVIPINKYGYIGEDFKTDDSTIYKIAIVGASGVAGPNHTLEYANFTFPLEEKLKNRNYAVQVLNCGVDGADRSYQLFQSIEQSVISFNMNLILFEYDLPLKSSNQVREPYRDHLLFYPCGNEDRLQDIQLKVDKLIQYNRFFHYVLFLFNMN